MELTKEYLQSIFDYKDGRLFWKVKKAQRLNVGDEAGCLDKRYLTTGLNGKVYRNHRLIFLMHHGYLPKEIDHKDNDQLNNRIENLRPATRSQNCSNTGIGKKNTSGVKGVSWSKRNNKWRGIKPYPRIFLVNQAFTGPSSGPQKYGSIDWYEAGRFPAPARFETPGMIDQ